MSLKTGRILILIGTVGLAVIALIQLIRGDYISAGVGLFGALIGAWAYTLNRRASKKTL